LGRRECGHRRTSSCVCGHGVLFRVNTLIPSTTKLRRHKRGAELQMRFAGQRSGGRLSRATDPRRPPGDPAHLAAASYRPSLPQVSPLRRAERGLWLRRRQGISAFRRVCTGNSARWQFTPLPIAGPPNPCLPGSHGGTGVDAGSLGTRQREVCSPEPHAQHRTRCLRVAVRIELFSPLRCSVIAGQRIRLCSSLST
jgi:hypothetical protein